MLTTGAQPGAVAAGAAGPGASGSGPSRDAAKKSGTGSVYIVLDSDDDAGEPAEIEKPGPSVPKTEPNGGNLARQRTSREGNDVARDGDLAADGNAARWGNRENAGLVGNGLGRAAEVYTLEDDDEDFWLAGLDPLPKKPRLSTSTTGANRPLSNVVVPADPTSNDSRDSDLVEIPGSASAPRKLAGAAPLSPEEQALKQIEEMFPDCSPSYVREQLQLYAADPPETRVLKVLEDIFASNGAYPKRGTEPQPAAAGSSAGAAGSASGPDGTSSAKAKGKAVKRDYGRVEEVKITVGPKYESESLALLASEFPRFQVETTIQNAFTARNNQFGPTFVYLSQLMEMVETNTLPLKLQLNDETATAGTKRKRGGKGKEAAPVATDSRLQEELVWAQEWKETQTQESEAALEDDELLLVGADGALEGIEMECGCCFAEYPLRDVVSCDAGHSFCKGCAKQHAETLIGARKIVISCMSTEVEGGCKAVFSRDEMRRFLPGKTLEAFDKISQQEEIRNALGHDALLECPFCDFAVLDEENDGSNTLFHCQNPSCGVVSCKKCKRPNHLPAKCGEEEKDRLIALQHKVEEEMTDALVRTCPKCPNSRFFKTEGCNKLMCPQCHSVICYICRKIIAGYDHFSHNGSGQPNPNSANKCALWDDTVRTDALAVNAAAAKALEELKQRDANAVNGLNVDLAEVPKANARSAMEYRDLPAPRPAAMAAIPANPQLILLQNQLLRELNAENIAKVNLNMVRGRIGALETNLNKERAKLNLEQLKLGNTSASQAKARTASERKIATSTRGIERFEKGLTAARAELPGLEAALAAAVARVAATRARVAAVPPLAPGMAAPAPAFQLALANVNMAAFANANVNAGVPAVYVPPAAARRRRRR